MVAPSGRCGCDKEILERMSDASGKTKMEQKLGSDFIT